MASESAINGNSATADAESAAQKLLAKHTSAHPVEIEDVVDEEDLAHPPPSAGFHSSLEKDMDSATAGATMSDIAQGKKKVDDIAEPKKPKGPAFDVKSDEAFPALGGPTPHTSAASTQSWGKKPPVMQTNGAKPSVNGSANGNSRTSTTRGYPTPSSTVPSQRMSLPGRHTESISLHPQQIAARKDLKKPLPEIIRDINKRSKATIVSREGPGGNLVFEGTGPQDAVQQALKDIVKEIGTKQSVKVPIPASVRPHIIGRQGATIQAISKKTGARVQIPKQEESASPADEDDDTMIDIVIEGDAIAAEMARREIEAIVNERTSTVNMRLKDIPAEFYPFLAGPNNSRIDRLEGGRDVKVQIPHYHTWRDQAPPQPAAHGQPVPFIPQPSLPIQIAGERMAVQEARREIENLVKSLSQQLTLREEMIERGRHQFIVGDRAGFSGHDFLAETGCALIKPPVGEDSDTLYIVGPADRIERGVDKMMELANQMQTMRLDASKAPGGNQQHARNMARYFQQRKALEELEKLHNASIVLPASADSNDWEVYAKDYKSTSNTHKEIKNLISAHPPSRFGPMQVDPFFHRQLQQREAPKIRREHGVHIVFPDGHVEEPEILLVYEAPGSPSEYAIPRQSCSSEDSREHQKAIQEARAYLQNIIAQQQNIVSRDLEAPPKFHDKLKKYVDREQKDLGQDKFPIQIMFGQAGQHAPGGYSIRGPNNAVDDLNTKIKAFLEQEAQDEAERGFTTSFDYPQKFANFLIGKRGENIKKLRDEFDVEIQVRDNKVELKGPEKKCAACKSHVLSQLKKFEDETTHTIKVKPQYHRDLIGAKGAQVNRLQDRYNVRVNFPRTQAPAEDDATEGSVRNYRNQAPDEVVIKGPRKGADECREEILNLLQWVTDHSYQGVVSVNQSQLPQLIGSQGREIEQLRLATGCQIDTPREAPDAKGRVQIKLRGTKKQVEDAQKELEQRVKTFDETVTKNIDVDRKHHKALIGPGGANVRKMVIDAGGPDDNRAIAQIVRFPKQGQEDNAIRVQGGKVLVEKVVAAINAQVKKKADQVTETLEVPIEKHRLLIGRGGETRRNLESKFNVQIDIPKQGATGPSASQVRISGMPSDVESARSHISGLVKEQEGETVQIPRKYHHVISDNGQFFRRLRNDYKVTVDHAGQQPPPRPATRNSRGRANGATPLITDDPSSDSHSWELVDNSSSSYTGVDGDEPIPWILRGSADNVAKAASALEKAKASAAEPSWSGFLILPDSRAHRHIIGPGGSQINAIRKQTGTKVQVPRGGGEGENEAVEIVGNKEGVESARDMILDIVRNAGNSGGSRRG